MEKILKKLDFFIRKYHFILLIKNIIFFSTYALLLILFFLFVEYSLWLNTIYRTIVFFFILGFTFIFGIWYFLLPFVKISKYYKKIDRFKAADIIGNYFPDISDRFRNLLELGKIKSISNENIQLLEAAIEQKINSIDKYSIDNAIDKTKIKKGVIFFLPVLLGFALLTFTSPSIVKEPFERIIQYNQNFTKPAPFEFVLLNKQLDGIQGESYIIKLMFKGDVLPGDAQIEINDYLYPMRKISNSKFEYEVNQLKSDFKFRFEANGYFSKQYYFNVQTKPSILSFVAELIYPAYIEKQNEILKNTTDFSLPQGTKIKWAFNAKDVYDLIAYTNKDTVKIENTVKQKNYFNFSKTFFSSQEILFTATNDNVNFTDSLKMFINVIPDQYPSIKLDEINDSILFSKRYFYGEILDDYGFSSLKFHYKAENEEEYNIIDIPFSNMIIQQEFFYMVDFSTIDNWRESKIEYFFSVSDNDGVNGAKTTKTSTKIFSLPDIKEMNNVYDEKQENLISDMSGSIEDVKKLKEEINDLRFDLMNKKTLNWEDKNKVQQLIEKQKQLELKIEDIKNQNLEKNLFEEQLKDMSPELIEKQKQLEELFDKVFDEEMKELMQQIQDLLKDLDKEQIMEQMEKIQMRSEDIEKELDRNLSLLKQLEFEKKMNDVIDKLEQNKEDLENLNKETENSSNSKEELQNKQEEINREFEKIQEEINQLEEMNDNLEHSMDFPEVNELMDNIKKDLQNSKESLSENKMKEASKNQKSGSEKIQQLSQKLQNAMQAFEQETLAEDIDNLKMILKNLINISFLQEKNMEFAKTISYRDPNFNKVVTSQKLIVNRFKIVEDSLYALSKRQVMIQPIITRDIANIKQYSKKIKEYFDRGSLSQAIPQEQYLMQSANNLALLLIEALEQMNNMMMQMQSGGSGQCNNPKPGSKPGAKPSPKTLKQLQEQLNQQMESLMKQMQKGNKEGGENPRISEQLAKMAAQQEAIRRKLQEYSETLKSEGQDTKLLNEIMKQMEQTEKEIVNKQLNQNTINRQKDILVRLMNSEKADLEREKEEKRTSKTGKVINKSNPEDFFQYKRNKESSEEVIKTIPPMFNSFYRQKINNFYLKLNN